jgi:predicted Fe-Mo cluster-binding NifX family protein
MTLLAIPNFGDRISPRIDYAESMQLVTINGKEIIKKEQIKIIAKSKLERINLIISIKPNIVICDGISQLLHEKLVENQIIVIASVHGSIDDVVKNFIRNHIPNDHVI